MSQLYMLRPQALCGCMRKAIQNTAFLMLLDTYTTYQQNVCFSQWYPPTHPHTPPPPTEFDRIRQFERLRLFLIPEAIWGMYRELHMLNALPQRYYSHILIWMHCKKDIVPMEVTGNWRGRSPLFCVCLYEQ